MKQLSWLILLIIIISNKAHAQIIPDSSLGAESSVVNSDENQDTINGGAIRNTNLFHSFQEFNVGAGKEAYFANPNDIANIFTRVTGNNISNIQGVLGVLGNANLFLINPNGILFGENARLDVNGSFFATTADSVLFDNGFEFSAANPNQPPLLTIDIPIGLRFRNNSGDIIVTGKGNGVRLSDSELIDTTEALRVDSDSTIGLIAGNLVFEDATIKTAGGRIELGSVAEGEVDLVEVSNGFTLDYSGVATFGDSLLSGTTVIDASGLGGGDIQVAGKNITLRDISTIEANTLGEKAAGSINIFAADSIEISSIENEGNFISGIFSIVDVNGTANAGDINITTENLSLGDRTAIWSNVLGTGHAGNISIDTGLLFLTNGASLLASTLGQGNGGNITVNARDGVFLDSSSDTLTAIGTFVSSSAIGNGGNITLTTPLLSLNNSSLLANTLGQGNAGNIAISTEQLFVNNGTLSSISSTTQGNAGNIAISTNQFSLTNSILSTNSSTTLGNAGNILIFATDLFMADDSLITSNLGSPQEILAAGKVGNILISAKEVNFSNTAQIQAGLFSGAIGEPGEISIIASESISFTGENTGIFSNTEVDSIGNASDIDMTTNALIFSDGARLSANNSGVGKGGNITINATDNISFTHDSSVSVNASEDNAGNIDITTNALIFSDGARLSANNFGTGTGGNVTINATDNISFTNDSRIGVIGSEGGLIDISAKNLSLMSNSDFLAGIGTNLGFVEARLGDIIINLTEDLILDKSGSISNNNFGTGNGNVGNIEITARNISLTNGGNIDSFVNGFGNGGNIILNATENILVDRNNNKELTGIVSLVQQEGKGISGDITVNAHNLSLMNGASITTQVIGIGDSGNININVKDSVTIDGDTGEIESSDGTLGIFPSSIRTDAIGFGNSGDITLTTQNLIITNGGNIFASIRGQGQAGRINLTTNNISVDGRGTSTLSSIASNVSVSGIGNGGSIDLSTDQFSLTNGALLTTSSLGQGNAGNISISANDTFVANNSLITSNIGSPQGATAVGKVGNISIEAREVVLTDTAQIQAGFFSQASGDSGIVSVRAKDSISFTGENTGIFSNTEVDAIGNGSDIELFTPSISLSNGAVLFADSAGEGNGGNINVYTNKLQMNRGIISSSTASGIGGEITLQISDDLTLRNNSLIAAQALKDANGGNIDVNARFIIAYPSQVDGNDIIASAEQGVGGEITITASALFGIEENKAIPGNRTNDIDASSQFGSSGIVDIRQPDVNPASGLVELTPEVVNAAELIAQNVCTQTANSEFVNIGKGGLPPIPDDVLTQNSIEVGLVAPVTGKDWETDRLGDLEAEEVGAQTLRPVTRKPPAQGWIWQEDGTVKLVAYNPTQQGEQRILNNSRSCN